MKGLFEAKIHHKRFRPKVNQFIYSGFYIKLSLNNLEQQQSRFFGIDRFNLFSFYRKDHGYRDGSDLLRWADDQLNAAGINDFNGKIVLQTFPRVFGYVFNPVSFWYCYQGKKLIAIICEVNNTFKESHNYVIKCDEDIVRKKLPKEFHVSPFYEVKGEYEFNFTKNNFVEISYFDNNEIQLIADIRGKEIPWNATNILKLIFKYPFFTIFVVFLIHYQALKLVFKRIKFFSKPEKLEKELTYEYRK